MELVWTAICRELHANKLKALVFINEIGVKRNVQIEDLAEFFRTHYVSNIAYSENGKIDSLGIRMSDLDTYNLTTKGDYKVTPGIGQTRIFGIVAPFMLNQKQKMKEDNMNGRMKTEKKQESNNNSSGDNDGLTGMQKLAVMTAVAGAAVAGANKLGKAIGNQINSKRNAEIKVEMYNKLHKYHSIIEDLIRIKNAVNNYIENHTEVLRYSVEFECKASRNEAMKQDFRQYGFGGYLDNIVTLIKACADNITCYGLMDQSLDDIGVSGSFRTLGNTLASRIDVVKQLHSKTQQLIIKNMDLKNSAIQTEEYMRRLAQEQEDLKRAINASINEVERNIEYARTCSTFDRGIEALNRINLGVIRDNIERIEDSNKKDEMYDYVYMLESMVNEIREQYRSMQDSAISSLINEVESNISNSALMISELKCGNHSRTEATNKITEIERIIQQTELKIETLPLDVRDMYTKNLKSVRDNLNNSERQIERAIAGYEENEILMGQVNDFKNKAIQLISTANDIKTKEKLDTYKRSYNSMKTEYRKWLNGLTNTTNNELKQSINEIEAHFESTLSSITQKMEEEENARENKVEAFKRLITNEINRIENIDITSCTLSMFEYNVGDVSEVSKTNGYTTSQVNDIKYEMQKLERIVKQKSTEMKNRNKNKIELNRRIDAEIIKVSFKINSITKPLKYYEVDSILNSINALMHKYDITLLDDVTFLQNKISELTEKFNAKREEFNF